jgi:hypothetical protein
LQPDGNSDWSPDSRPTAASRTIIRDINFMGRSFDARKPPFASASSAAVQRLLSFAIDPQLRICDLCRTAYPRRTYASAMSQSPLWRCTDHLRETQRTHAERICPFDRFGSASLTHSRGQEVGFADRCSELAWRTHADFTIQHLERVN